MRRVFCWIAVDSERFSNHTFDTIALDSWTRGFFADDHAKTTVIHLVFSGENQKFRTTDAIFIGLENVIKLIRILQPETRRETMRRLSMMRLFR